MLFLIVTFNLFLLSIPALYNRNTEWRMNPHLQKEIIKRTRTSIKHHAMMITSLYANLTRVVNKRKASLLGLE